MRASVRIGFAVLVGLSAMPGLADDADGAPAAVDLDDLGAIESLGAPRLSPDGERVAFAYDGRIRIVEADGGEPRPVTAGDATASTPRWSADGEWLYFLSDRSGSRQLWRLPVATFGEARQVTDTAEGLDALRLSPGEGRLLRIVDGTDASAEDDDDKPQPWVITRRQYKQDSGDGYITQPPAEHVHVLDLDAEEGRRLTAGAFDDAEPAWSPDGKRAVFVSSRPEHPDAGYANDLWLVATTADGATQESANLRRLTDNERVKSDPAFSPDGAEIVYRSAADGVYGNPQLRAVSVDGGEPETLAPDLDRRILDFAFGPDGDWIYFIYPDRGAQHLARLHRANGEIQTLVDGRRLVTAFDVGADGVVVARITERAGSDDLYRIGGEGDLHRLTDLHGDFLDEHRLGRREKIRYTVEDGTEVEAFVTHPPGFDPEQRYPAILKIHGGPVGQVTWGYDFESQLLAARGYLVIEPNPRGSTGRGQAFVRAIERSWGVTDYPDVIGAVDRAIELGYADPERLAVTGYSYGGYMTNVVVTRSDRFQAAASGAGHSLIIANYGHDIWGKWYDWELGLPAENRAHYDRLSPLLDVAEVTTPTLLLGGEDDWNVPILNSELFYQSLRTRGVETRLVVYPDSHHGGWPERFERDYWERVIGWFERFNKAGSG